MSQFTGSLYRGDTLLHEHISGSYQVTESRFGIKSWRGYIEADGAVMVGEYTIHFDDGQQGDILVTRLDFGSHTSSRAQPFTGSGAIRKPVA